MGYLPCIAESSISPCRSLSAVATKNHHHPVADGEETAHSAAGTARDHHRRSCIYHFTHRQMEDATSSFSEDVLLGRGSHGSVYKAHLPSGRVVAVKRPSRNRNRHTPVKVVVPALPHPGAGGGSSSSNNTTSGSRDEVENEIEVLSKVHGPRLVNLVGFTTDPENHKVNHLAGHASSSSSSSSSSSAFSGSFRKERLLALEYMPNGTLYDLLHSNPRPPGWARRLRLALQTAKAIHFLHSHHPPVIHRDVKSANVLLDDRHNARLGDFGLAVFCANKALGPATTPTSSPFVPSTPPAGTFGYLDPGYVSPENLSTKTDVFSFGILLLEIISGRKAIDISHSPPSIVEWAVPLIRKGKILSLYDQRIAPPRDPNVQRQLAALVACCVRSTRDRRPSMDEVIDRLKMACKTVPQKFWNGLTIGNPCSVVETVGNSITKRSSPTNTDDCTSSPRGSMTEFTEETAAGLTSATPLGASSQRSGSGVFSDSASGVQNLVGLLRAPNEATVGAICGSFGDRRRRKSHIGERT